MFRNLTFLLTLLLIVTVGRASALYGSVVSMATTTSACPDGMTTFQLTVYTAAWGGEVSWYILNEDDEVLYEDDEYWDNSTYTYEICLEDGCYIFHMHDSYGDGWNGGSFILTDEFGETVVSGALETGTDGELTFGVNSWCPVYGCIDPNSINFNQQANTDDGSCIAFESSNLPIVLIDTDGQYIPDNPRITAHMGIIHNASGINTLNDSLNNYDGQISIEIRGSSSQGFPKKSFALETQNEDGTNNNVSLIDMPAENDWILHAPYSDKSLMRNALTFDLGRKAGRYTPRTKFCELFINGEYKGIYLLMESIKRDANRIDIANLLPQDTVGDELTGGYILKVDKFTGSGGEGWYSDFETQGQANDLYIQYHRPKGDQLAEVQKQYIHAFVDEFESALAGENFADTAEGYAKYIDPLSFIDLSLINELSRNIDGYRLSTYFHKDKDSNGGKIVMGAWWDYNLTYGNADYCEGGDIDGWEVESGCGNDNPFWFERLKEDENYTNQMRCRWNKLRSDQWSDSAIAHIVDSMTTLIYDAQLRNFAIWDILGTYVWPNVYTSSETHQDEVDYMMDWLEGRLLWIDENLPGTCVEGCMDAAACNFMPEAMCDNGTCVYVGNLDILGEYTVNYGTGYVYTYPGSNDNVYYWTVTGGVIVSGQGTTTVDILWNEEGIGQVTVTEANDDGCVGDPVVLDVLVVIPQDVASFTDLDVQLFPNPNNGQFELLLPGFEGTLECALIDLAGREVYRSTFAARDKIQMTLDLPVGSYLLRIGTKENSRTLRVVIN